MHEPEPCRMCGGDGRVSNAFGGSGATCPSCHGSGRRAIDTGFHDVTKTKPSHHRPTAAKAAEAATKAQFPTTGEGIALGKQIQESALAAETKTKLIREVIEYEASHGQCTQTFIKKMRKQVR